MFKPAINLSHIIVNVPDLDRSLAFYRDKLDFRVILEARNVEVIAGSGRLLSVALVERADDVIGMVELIQFASQTQPSTSSSSGAGFGLWAITWEVKDLDALYEEWGQRGVKFTQEPNLQVIPGCGKFYSALMTDVDGNRIELVTQVE